MNTPAQQQVQQLLQPMLKMTLFAAMSKALRPAEEIAPFVVEHFEYMLELEKQGILFASGPFVEPGVLVGSGLTILRAKNLSDARTYMDEEPLIKRGLREYEIWEWELREGCINVGIEFGTGKYTFK